jgi:carbonic anhydrase
LEAKESFVGRWMDILKPKFTLVEDIDDAENQARQFERQAVVASLENLMTFPFIEDAVSEGSLSLHGLWTDIGEGGLECYDPKTGAFQQV